MTPATPPPVTPQRLTRATRSEMHALTALCLASKAHWGYDAHFLAACEAELTFTTQDLSQHVAVIRRGPGFAGVVQASLSGEEAELDRLFVAPGAIRQGLGRALMGWVTADLRAAGGTALFIASDPGAVRVYEGLGAEIIGTEASGSIPGRRLPRLRLPLG